jgi:hypothetical protein
LIRFVVEGGYHESVALSGGEDPNRLRVRVRVFAEVAERKRRIEELRAKRPELFAACERVLTCLCFDPYIAMLYLPDADEAISGALAFVNSNGGAA